jgi:hypothetical protein
VRTMARRTHDDGIFPIYALHCDYCLTTSGPAIMRIVVISSDCEKIYETYVRQDNPIMHFDDSLESHFPDRMRTGIQTQQGYRSAYDFYNPRLPITAPISHSAIIETRMVKWQRCNIITSFFLSFSSQQPQTICKSKLINYS